MNRMMIACVGATLCCVMSAASSLAGVTFTAREVDGDVVFEGSGTLDYSLWTFSHDFPSLPAQINSAFVLLGGDADVYGSPSGFEGPSDFSGPSTTRFADSNTGDVFGLQLRARVVLVVPDGYTSGDPLSGSMTFKGETFDSLDMEVGEYTWTWDVDGGGKDFFTVNIVVPTPSALPLMTASCLLVRRRRRSR